jgi:2-dehydropantoate 2-reductase
MALDIARGQPTEIDELTGFIVREGERLKIPVPNCQAVYRLVSIGAQTKDNSTS